MCLYYINDVKITFKYIIYCVNIYKNCSNIVQILYKYCANITQILRKYCANIVQILCKQRHLARLYKFRVRAQNQKIPIMVCQSVSQLVSNILYVVQSSVATKNENKHTVSHTHKSATELLLQLKMVFKQDHPKVIILELPSSASASTSTLVELRLLYSQLIQPPTHPQDQ